jgi:hypothetical protein
MRCGRCHVENIPGRDRCFKCGTVLEATSELVDIHPPRMSGWRRPVRGLVRWFRRQRVFVKPPGKNVQRVLDRLTSDGLIGLVVSVIPGLAHFAKGRFREVRLYVLLWAALLCTGLFLYGSGAGYVLIGLAIGLHAFIALQFGLFKEIVDFAQRMVATLLVTACFALLYFGVPRVVFGGYTGGHTALTIPDMRINAGDYLVVRRSRRPKDVFPRGTLVLFRPLRLRNYRVDVFNEQPSMIGQIVGLPGDTVYIAKGVYASGGKPLNPERFPVPRWLQDRVMTVVVPPGSYFVSSPYIVRGRAGALTDAAVRDACLIKMEVIEGRAFMRWWPLQRRGFIE